MTNYGCKIVVEVILLRLYVPKNAVRREGHFMCILSNLSHVLRGGLDKYSLTLRAQAVHFLKIEKYVRKCSNQNIF